MKLIRITAAASILSVFIMLNMEAEAGFNFANQAANRIISARGQAQKYYVENFGTGVHKKGGTYTAISLDTLEDNDELSFRCVSGRCNTVTIHGRTSSGVWNTLYRGKPDNLTAGRILSGKRARYTHINISVNGAHERYDRVKARLEITVSKNSPSGSDKSDSSDGLFVENFGTGTSKTGGNYRALDLKTLGDNDELSFKCVSGRCNTVTAHGRTSSGVWKTLYQGKLKTLKVGELLSGNRARYTHINISVNGAHERYDRTKAKMQIIIKKDSSSIRENAAGDEPSNQGSKSVTEIKGSSVTVTAFDSTTNSGSNYFKFTITKQAEVNYRLYVNDPTQKGHFNIKLYRDPDFSQEISTGRGNWDYTPTGEKMGFRDYKLGKGTYYMNAVNSNKSGRIKVTAGYFEYNTQWDNER